MWDWMPDPGWVNVVDAGQDPEYLGSTIVDDDTFFPQWDKSFALSGQNIYEG